MPSDDAVTLTAAAQIAPRLRATNCQKRANVENGELMGQVRTAEQPKIGQAPARKTRIPDASYRLQFNAQFTFQDALQILDYLNELGISDIYASPLLQAAPGSQHGYDVCDPGRLNSELGGDEDFEQLVQALQARNMGLLVDTVPNHMGIADDCNLWWTDVLENGPISQYATLFRY